MSSSEFSWPNGSECAVSLTYDDGRLTHVTNVIPQLQDSNLRGSFYLIRDSAISLIDYWKHAANAQHEIGSHSCTHPGSPATIPEIDPNTGSQTEYWAQYDEYSFYKNEIDELEFQLSDRINAKFANKPRTWAYPGGVMRLQTPDDQGAQRYEKLIACNYRAARANYDDPNDPGPQNPYTVANRRYQIAAKALTWGYPNADNSIAYMNEALVKSRWAVLIFHDVFNKEPDKPDETSQRAHQEIIDWIKQNKVWCAPFGEVFDYVRSQLDGTLFERLTRDCTNLGS